jgi:hypothetical protein
VRITRVYTGADNRTHFADADIALQDHGTIGLLSDAVPATGVIFRETPADYEFDWHPAPQRQYIVLLDGMIEIEVGDGEVRTFGNGDVLLVEDTEGQGHRTRALDGNRRRSLFITLA